MRSVTFGFSTALEAVKAGKPISRRGWNGPNQSVRVMPSGDGADVTLPYLYLTNTLGDTVPWVPSMGDLFAEDWQTV